MSISASIHNKLSVFVKEIFLFSYAILFICFLFNPAVAQTVSPHNFSLQECLNAVYKNNEGLKIADLEVAYQREFKKTAFDIPKTSFAFTQGQFNSIYKYDNNITVSQTIPFPTVISAHSSLSKSQIKGSELSLSMVKMDLTLKTKEAFYNLQHSLQEIDLLHLEDSVYDVFLKIEKSKTEISGVKALEKISLESQSYLIKSTLNENRQLITNDRIFLQSLIHSAELPFVVRLRDKDRILFLDTSIGNVKQHPSLLQLKQEIEISERAKKLERTKGMPDIVLGYFNQTIYGPANIFGEDYFLTTSNRLQGFQLGLLVPLFFSAHHAKVKAASVTQEIASQKFKQYETIMTGEYKQALNKYLSTKQNLEFYNEFMLKNAKDMITEALLAYNKNEISYFEYLQSISKSLEIERNYVHLIHQNNLAVIQLEYFLSN